MRSRQVDDDRTTSRRPAGRRAFRALAGLTLQVLSALQIGCAEAPVPTLYSVFHQQKAPEYRGVCRTVYAAARDRLDAALADPGWTASVEQEDMARPWPEATAVVFDVDETVLDNSAFYARAVVDPSVDLGAESGAWIESARAVAIEGAVATAREALERGVTVFLVSNRSCTQDPATRRNLERVGFPVDHPGVHFLSRNVSSGAAPGAVPTVDDCPEMEALSHRLLGVEDPRWYAFKGYRRQAIAGRFRILFQFGDSQGDFYSPFPSPDAPEAERRRLLDGHLDPAEREEIARRDGSRMAGRWMVLPNSMYGKWLDSWIGYGSLTPAQVVERATPRLAVE